ncbi:hypothetical protein PROP_02325 [Propionicimonas sp. T2.31MG-18]|uniref:DUF2207 domain-containing protein n=1 Tax=Propionicimonas sp. T2.31MG-18 TaxID=3157620 RepID=UPI0035EEAAA3
MSVRAPGRWLAALAVLLLTGWISLGSATVAYAASGDVFDRFDVVATVDSQGFVNVTETIVLRFGASSGRHGLERTLITREPDGDENDVVYRIDRVSVTSPDPVSTELDTSEQGSGRTTYLRIRVGSADRTISAPTATYVLSYRVAGLLRTSGTYDELYWDVTGASMPTIAEASVRVDVPGGAQAVFCSVAMPGERGDCDSAAVTAGSGRFAATGIAPGEVMTVSVKIGPGLIAGNTPIRVENADTESARLGSWLLGGSLGAAALVPFVGWWYVRRRSRDLRFEGMPPGTFPPPGVAAREVPSDPRMEVPVSFAPPSVPVAEAGLLLDGQSDVRDTTATLVQLAVSGAVQLRSDATRQVRLVDASRAPDRTAKLLLRSLFPKGTDQGAQVDLGEPGTLSEGHRKVTQAVQERSRAEGWFLRAPGAGSALAGLGGLFFPVLVGGIVGVVFLGPLLLIVLPVLLAVVITALVARSKLKRGQRSAVGRALTDQVEGFRTYLATAEAEQLQFEEGEDIFSKYLPWAVAFDLTDRWTRVCQRLVELGRLPATAPVWYYGSTWDFGSLGRQFDDLDSSVGSSIATPAPTFSESGFGSSGSAFDSGGFSSGGGGFSGGGGGGGGGGSW